MRPSSALTSLTRLLWLALCLTLNACSLYSIKDADFSEPDFVFKGKLAVQSAEQGNGKASFHWFQKDKHYRILILNPLGQIELTITGAPGKAIAFTPSGEKLSASSAEALLEKASGWTFPVSALPHWLNNHTQGIETDVIHDESGQLKSLQYEDWAITIERHKRFGSTLRPAKLRIKKEGTDILIVIKDYS